MKDFINDYYISLTLFVDHISFCFFEKNKLFLLQFWKIYLLLPFKNFVYYMDLQIFDYNVCWRDFLHISSAQYFLNILKLCVYSVFKIFFITYILFCFCLSYLFILYETPIIHILRWLKMPCSTTKLSSVPCVFLLFKKVYFGYILLLYVQVH